MLLLLLLLLLPLLLLLSLLLLLQLAVDVQDVHETVVEEEVDAGDRAISFARLAARRLLTGAHPACSLSTGFGPSNGVIRAQCIRVPPCRRGTRDLFGSSNP